jgi:hypothetical protein
LFLSPGNNLVANQLDNGTGDTLNQVILAPEGATFTKWDASQNQYLPVSTYDTNSGWSINYTLNFGEGGLLNTPSAFTNSFTGTLWPGWNILGPFVPPAITNTGVFLLSCYIPLNSATFSDVVGRNPLEGESVTMLNPATQALTTTTYHSGFWDNGDPLLDAGQSAFFNLGPTLFVVPEPTIGALAGVGLLCLGTRRFLRRDT